MENEILARCELCGVRIFALIETVSKRYSIRPDGTIRTCAVCHFLLASNDYEAADERALKKIRGDKDG